MKTVKYICAILAVAALAVSCQKHVIHYIGEEALGEDMARFNICYFNPVSSSVAANKIDSVLVNDKFVTGIGGVGQLGVNASVPSFGAGCFFTAPKGTINIKLFQGGVATYDRDIVINDTDPRSVFFTKTDVEPCLVNYNYPFDVTSGPTTADKFDSDSITLVRFVNVVFENINGNVAPTTRILQYQWRWKNDTKDESGEYHWSNVGGPVAFGQASAREKVPYHKDTFNTSGQSRVDYRVIDATTGEELDTDYWTAYAGRAPMHVFRGVLNGSPASAITQLYDNY